MRFDEFRIFIYGIWLVPLLALFYIWAMRRRAALMERFAGRELIPRIAPSYDMRREALGDLANVLAVLFIVLALARPQWGYYWKEEKYRGIDMVFAIDTSKSMLAQDMRPDRLGFARDEIEVFIKALKKDRVGLIAFSGDAFLQCPLTGDHGGFILALNDLSTETIPKGGTSLPAAIEEAVRSFRGAETRDKVLIIITDGENTEGDLDKALQEAKTESIMISCVGIGTPEGEVIPVIDENGGRTYVRDKAGNIVKSRLMEKTLERIAESTGGLYVRATNTDLGLDRIYGEKLAKLEKKDIEGRKVKVYKQRFQYPLGLALLMFFLQLFIRKN